MSLRIIVKHPDYPKDRSKAEALSKKQFAIVHDYIVGCMNNGKTISEKVIITACANAGRPLFAAAPTPTGSTKP